MNHVCRLLAKNHEIYNQSGEDGLKQSAGLTGCVGEVAGGGYNFENHENFQQMFSSGHARVLDISLKFFGGNDSFGSVFKGHGCDSQSKY